MKTILKVIGVTLCLIAFTQNSNAQFGASVGTELVIPFEDGFGVGFGIGVGGEYGLDDQSGITGQLGYTFLSTDGDNSSASMIPIQFGYKYYFDSKDKGFYGHGQLGFHMFKYSYEYETYDQINMTTGAITYKTVKESNTNTDFSLAFGGGYMINENIDLGLRYNMIFGDGHTFDYLAFRAAYNF